MKSIVIALTALVAALPQQFRSGINTVEIYATVVDRDGRLIPDLSQEDFQVFDNGKPQKIELFSRDTQPITIALMIDESPSIDQVRGRIASAVREFSKHFLPGDRATLGAFSHLVRIEPALSSTPAERIPALIGGRPRFPAGTALWDALDVARDVLKNEPGRRVILVLTDADDNCSQLAAEQVLAQLERESSMVYAIGVKGNSGLPVAELRTVTRDSGGYYFELKRDDDLAETFARVADELHRQYLIGFVPAVLDGKRHTLDVRTSRSGLTVRARRAYVASKSGGAGGAW